MPERRVPLRAGVLLAAAWAAAAGHGEGPWGALQWAAWSPLLAVTLREGPRAAFAWGLCFGTAAWAFGLAWLGKSMSVFLAAPAPVLWGAAALFYLHHGLMFGLFAAGLSWLTPRLEARLGLPRAPALWLASALAMSCAETLWPVFVPVRLAATQLWHVPLAQSAALDGGLLVLAVVMGANAALACVREPGSRWRPVLAAAAAGALALEAYGLWAVARLDARPPGRTLRVALLQPALSVKEEGALAVARNLGVLKGLSDGAAAAGPVDLFVWPESVHMTGREIVFQSDGRRWRSPSLGSLPLDAAGARELPASAPTLATAWVRAGPRRYNAALLYGPGGEFLGLTRKRWLLPFGEAVPLAGRLPRLKELFPNSPHLTPGRRGRVLRLPSGAALGALVCYEDTIPRQTADLAGAGARLLVDMTNDASLRHPKALSGHLFFSRLRAVETGLPLLRAANTGISALIDPAGRVKAALAPGERGVLRVEVAPAAGATPYVRRFRGLRAAANLLLAGLVLLCAFPSLLPAGAAAPRASTG